MSTEEGRSGGSGKDKTREVSYSIFKLKQQQTEYVGLYTTVKCMGRCLGGQAG